MDETRQYGVGNHLGIEQILLEAQHRWLRPAEICEILQNYKKFCIAPEPAHMPPSGSLFLFNRKVLRYFRKDGHNWRKKKDGKTVKEAHERLKAGRVDVLHCYYAHGEGNEYFQRRSYWMLEEELSHIVLVHYLEVKGNGTNFNCIKVPEEAVSSSKETENIICNAEVDTSLSSSFHPNNYQVPSQNDTISMNSPQTSEHAESAYNSQGGSSRFHSFFELEQPVVEKINAQLPDTYYPLPFSNDYQEKFSAIPRADFMSLSQVDKTEDSNNAELAYESRKLRDFQLWEDGLENTAGTQPVSFQPLFPEMRSDTVEINTKPKQGNEMLEQLFTSSIAKRQDTGNLREVQGNWQASGANSSCLSNWPIDQDLHRHLVSDVTSGHHEQKVDYVDLGESFEPGLVHPDKKNEYFQKNVLQKQILDTEHENYVKSDLETNTYIDGKANYRSTSKLSLLDRSCAEGLIKLDSFNRWMNNELGDVDERNMQSSSGADWDTIESENGINNSTISSQVHLNSYLLGPSLSHDQLFSIIDFSPSWANEGSQTKVLITGRFLRSQQEAENCKWSCMFGEVEIPAEVITDGVLRCHAPLHKAGRVPFYVTCSNRLACSEVREFEFRINYTREVTIVDKCTGRSSETLNMRFGKMLLLGSSSPKIFSPNNVSDKSNLSSKIISLLKEDSDQWDQLLKLTLEKDFSRENLQEQLLQKLLKEKLQTWLLQKVDEGGKGPNVLDDDGQGVLHFAAALDYNWALQPTIVSGVNVNFRDVKGWTALHWAAFCGREKTVASLISLGAAPGALTDPCPEHPSGRTPADLASENGHKGIAGYLAGSALSAHLLSLNLDSKEGGAAEVSGTKTVHRLPEQGAASIHDDDVSYGLSLKDSLAAVCNATQAAARIHQVFRVQSFQKKQLREYRDNKLGISDEHALSLITVKSHKPGQHDEPVHAAAIRIQNEFRSWKGRKDFLIIRQRIVKIQAHVRGHQVRKNYRKIIWSVGIMEKVILRWRRKGSGLRGFKPEAITAGPSKQSISKEDDYDFLKEGRKQTEERLQKALARVKSMVQYPEARDQYSRLLNVVTNIKET
ncbi:Calmodulin-binding transcription activator 2 [Quillaja saponaria]|uniref:Calmodulin-binding transcription activator 2 n=1 Tax=Quillaja saponaria TaxID=32244 RepID=A0AAD7LEQ5_QUISA|nr:Calmodulin-binding transcription activator 2 [Quillaja saponaria]